MTTTVSYSITAAVVGRLAWSLGLHWVGYVMTTLAVLMLSVTVVHAVHRGGR